MADPFVAEIRIFPFNFAPRGWAFCDGQIMPISQNTALFSLLGTTYGGDGRSNFALPNLQGRAAMHPGQGLGLSPHDLGESRGVETVTLLSTEIPAHAHVLTASNETGEDRKAVGEAMARSTGGPLYGPATNLVAMAAEALPIAGASQPHNNMMPYLTLNFCIALQGVFPPRGVP
jgi:microcystin-dependent protein